MYETRFPRAVLSGCVCLRPGSLHAGDWAGTAAERWAVPRTVSLQYPS